MNLNETSNSKRLFGSVDQTPKSPTLTADQRYDSEASLVSIGSTMSVMEQPHSLAVLGNITQVGKIDFSIEWWQIAQIWFWKRYLRVMLSFSYPWTWLVMAHYWFMTSSIHNIDFWLWLYDVITRLWVKAGQLHGYGSIIFTRRLRSQNQISAILHHSREIHETGR